MAKEADRNAQIYQSEEIQSEEHARQWQKC